MMMMMMMMMMMKAMISHNDDDDDVYVDNNYNDNGDDDNERARTVLKSPWILWRVLEKSVDSTFPWKVFKLRASPWKFLEFSSTFF